MSATCQPWGSPQKTCTCTCNRNCTYLCTCILHRVNTRTSSPLLSPQRLSVSSSMTPGRRARARRERLDRRLKVSDGERRSGPAPVVSCQRPLQHHPEAHIRCLPGRPPSLPVPCSALTVSNHLCALNQGPLTRYLLSFQMTSLALASLDAPPVIVRGNKIENYASSSRCGDLRDQLPPVSEAPQ